MRRHAHIFINEEAVRFELTRSFRPCRFSRPEPSTARPRLLNRLAGEEDLERTTCGFGDATLPIELLPFNTILVPLFRKNY